MNRSGYSFVIAERDNAGMRALSELNSRGLNTTANALAQSADHIKDSSRCSAPSSVSTSAA